MIPISAKILALVPQPLGGNAAAGQASNNYQGTFDSSRMSAIPSIKIDQNVGSKGRLSFYYQDTHTTVPRTPTGADAFADNITASATAFNSGQTMRLNFDYSATPRLLLHWRHRLERQRLRSRIPDSWTTMRRRNWA